MKCGVHSEKEAIGTCVECGIAFCEECQVIIKGKNLCKKCVDVFFKKNQSLDRNPVLATVLSFIFPGAGQVYNGQIGKGVLIFLTCWLFIPWIYGIIDAYVTAEKIKNGQIDTKSTSVGCLIALILIFAIVPGCALLSAIAIPNLLRARLSANDALAQATLRTLSTASETYATANEGKYPDYISLLLNADPPYLNADYCNQTISGFSYKCQMSVNSYKFIAIPVEPGTSGTANYTIVTGGILETEKSEH